MMSRFSGTQLLPLSLGLCLFFVAACAPSRETERADRTEEFAEGEELLEKYEKTFRPEQFGPSLEEIEQLAKTDTTAAERIVEPEEEKLPETIPGFRVQVFSTTNIDAANALKSGVEAVLRGHTVYITFDSPYYKVRAGDFLSRPDANPLLKFLLNSGYKDAWIVADRVVKNPPPRLPPPSHTKKPE